MPTPGTLFGLELTPRELRMMLGILSLAVLGAAVRFWHLWR